MLGGIVHRDLFSGFDDPNRDIVPAGASGVRITGVVDESRRRPHQDVFAVDDLEKNPLARWKSLDRFVAQYFPASIDDDVARLKASCRKDPSPVNRRVVYDDVIHLRANSRLADSGESSLYRRVNQLLREHFT